MAQTLSVEEMLPAKFTPMMKRHFVFAIEGIDAFLIKTASRPEITTEEVAINWINSTRYVAGKTTFGQMSVTLHDPIAPSGAQQVMEWVRLSHESVTGRDGYSDFYKKDITLHTLGPVGDKVEEWTLKGAFITATTFGEMDWANDAFVEISLTLAYDYAILQY